MPQGQLPNSAGMACCGGAAGTAGAGNDAQVEAPRPPPFGTHMATGAHGAGARARAPLKRMRSRSASGLPPASPGPALDNPVRLLGPHPPADPAQRRGAARGAGGAPPAPARASPAAASGAKSSPLSEVHCSSAPAHAGHHDVGAAVAPADRLDCTMHTREDLNVDGATAGPHPSSHGERERATVTGAAPSPVALAATVEASSLGAAAVHREGVHARAKRGLGTDASPSGDVQALEGRRMGEKRSRQLAAADFTAAGADEVDKGVCALRQGKL
jgi:hypothetical protein